MGRHPDGFQIRMAQANDAEYAVEEVGKPIPAEVPMLWVFVPPENPMERHRRNNILRLVVAQRTSFLRRGHVWEYCVHG